MDRSLRFAASLAAAALAACDPMYGVLSYSPLVSAADPACIDRTLRAVPGVGDVTMTQSEYRSFEIAPDWGRKVTYSTLWTYAAGGQTIHLQAIRQGPEFTYRNSMSRMGRRFPTPELDAAEATIKRVDAAVLAGCSLEPRRRLSTKRY